MSKQKLTYVTYNQGLDVKHLHLGNLVHDYKKPLAFEPYVDKSYTDIAESPPEWARSMALENFALTLGKGSAEEENDSADEKEGRYRVVAAAKTTRLEINDAEEFLNNVTLKNDKAKKWLSAHISVAESLFPTSHTKPPIWMCTGLVLMTHATWTSLSSTATFTPGMPAPFNPSAVSEIRRSSVSEGVRPTIGFEETEHSKRIGNAIIYETGKYPGTRGWAAQWERVDVRIVGESEWKGGVDNQFMLKTKGEQKIAVVELEEGVFGGVEDGVKESAIDDDYWDAFLDGCEDDA